MNYLELLDSYKEEMLVSLEKLVNIDTVLADAYTDTDGSVYPFGKGIQDCFVEALKLGDEMGFDTLNVDNYGGHIEYKAEDAENADIFGIAAHLDVVPVGTGWTGDPFVMRQENGYVYGRGTSDDKGPMIACLYAMKAIKEAGIVPKKNIRMILGLDEETEKNGMVYYTEKVGQPTMGITPDGEFPLIHGELGILIFELAQKFDKKPGKDGLRLTKLDAGIAPNSVPADARAVLAASDAAVYDEIKAKLEKYNEETGYKITAKKQGSALVLDAAGVAAHGACPELGLNAISVMLGFLGQLNFACDELNDFFDFYNEHIAFYLRGEGMGCAFEDEASGKLIWNVGMASFDEESASVTINARYPVSNTAEEVFAGIEGVLADTKIGIVKRMSENPVFLSLENEMVEKLMAAYVDETGDIEHKPMVIGGGTYAKLLNDTLAFGGLFPGEDDTMHQTNERMSIESFYKMARIYARAIYSICC